MLRFITDAQDNMLDYVRDDPVRPEIPREFRVSKNRFVMALDEDNKPQAMVCVSLHDFVPAAVIDLSTDTDQPTTAIFYTIWSYKAGKGRDLLIQAVKGIQEQYPSVTRFVTLSPKTELARRFHLKNGAIVFRENIESVNYEYNTNK